MAFNYSPKIVTDGLVLYLDAANTRSYPGTGTTWSDLSRGGNNGTLTNGPTFNSGNGGSIVFDGTNDYVSGSLNSQLSSNFTFSCFVKPLSSAGSSAKGIIVSEVASYSNFWALLGTFNSKWCWSLFDGINNPILLSSITPSISTWVHLTGVRNTVTDNLTLYINGLLDNTLNDNTTNIPVYSALNIGGQVSQGAQVRYFNGNISQTLIYNRALTASEVLQNYNATKTRFGL